MKTEIQIYNNPQFGEIRAMQSEKGEPLFYGTDICNALGYSNPSKAIKDHTEEDERSNETLDRGGFALFINESGLYSLIMRSKKPEAKRFRKWVTSEVLPSIRKNGGYIVTKPEDTSETILARAVLLANATLKALETKNKLLESCNQDNVKKLQDQAPKVLFADSVATSDKSILIGEMAKILCQNGYEIGQNRFFVWLRTNGFLGTRGENYNIPNQKAIEAGLFEIKETTINQPGGKVLISITPKVTGKGQLYFVNKFLSKVTQEA